MDDLLFDQLPKIIDRHEALDAASVQTQVHRDRGVLLRIIADLQEYIDAQTALKKRGRDPKPKESKPRREYPMKVNPIGYNDTSAWLKPIYEHICQQHAQGKRLYRGYFSRADQRAVTVLISRGDVVMKWDENHELQYLEPAQAVQS